MNKKLFLFTALIAFSFPGLHAAEEKNAHGHGHWGYVGKAGAKHWGDMQPDYVTCKVGKEQSPVDIRGATSLQLPAIDFNYAGGAAEVVNNGHTIQVNLASDSTVKLASGEYKLMQFHFHTPSEERVNGKTYSLVAHFVHKNEEGNLAVVSVLFKRGKQNPTLAKIFSVMPTRVGDKADLLNGLNPMDLLPSKREYFAFMGSLTTPPCTEGVRWQVLKQPVEWSEAQSIAFKKLYPMNARPVQPLNGRSIGQSI